MNGFGGGNFVACLRQLSIMCWGLSILASLPEYLGVNEWQKRGGWVRVQTLQGGFNRQGLSQMPLGFLHIHIHLFL